MAVAVSATGTAAYNSTGASTQTFTFSVNSGDALAVFFICTDSAASSNISSVTWDSGGTNQTCSSIASAKCTTNGNGSINAWGVVQPASGTLTLQVVQNLSYAMSANMQTYTGVASTSMATAVSQGSGVATSNQTISAPSVTGASGDMNVAAFMGIGSFTANSDTLIYSFAPAGKHSIANLFSSTGSAHTLTATQNAVQQACDISFNIVAGAGPSLAGQLAGIIGMGAAEW